MLNVTDAVATSRKNERKPASRRSRSERHMMSRARITNSSTCTMPSSTVDAK